MEVNPEFRKGDVLEYIGDCILKCEKKDIPKALEFYQQANEYEIQPLETHENNKDEVKKIAQVSI